jgi:DHA1 family bicyclomycin/chloramphenicol resistance-like MFS transporter
VAAVPVRLLLVLGAISALTPASIDMYLPSFPLLARDLGTTPGSVQLTLSTYLVGLTVGQTLYGPLSDRLGRRPPLLAGLTLYVVASAGCAAATRIDVLIALRLIQALGGSACLVIPRAIVRDRFEVQAAARVFSHLMLVIGAAPILAPIVGGQIAGVAGWRGVFVTLAALGVSGLVLALVALPESRPPGQARARGPGAGLEDYLVLLGDRRFMGFAAGGGLAMAGMFAYIAESPFVLNQLYGLSPVAFALAFGSNAAGLIAASQLNGWLLARMEPERLLARALPATALIGVALLVVTAADLGGLPGLLALLFAYMASRGFVQPNAVACALAHHPRRAGSASALIGVLQFGASTLASVLAGALHDGSALPMAAVMAVTAVLAAVACWGLAWRRPRDTA